MLTVFPRARTDSRRARTLAGTAQHCKEKIGLKGKHRESAELPRWPLKDVCVLKGRSVGQQQYANRKMHVKQLLHQEKGTK